MDDLPVRLGDAAEPRQRDGIAAARVAGLGILAADHEARLVAGAARGQHGARVRELQRRDLREALAYPRDDGLARKPDLVLGPREPLALPLGRGHDSGALAAYVYARARAEAGVVKEIRHVADTEVDGELVEVDVARLHDRRVQRHLAVAGGAPVAVPVRMPRQREEARAEFRLLGPLRLVVQRGEPEERLDRRARRITPRQRPVEHRLVRIGVERDEIVAAQALREPVRVERRRADEREQVAVARIDRHGRAAHAPERLVGGELQAHVQRDDDVAPRRGPARLELADAADRRGARRIGRGIEQDAPLCVDELLAIADRAVQHLLVAALDAALADLRGRGVIAAVDALEVRAADLADVTHRVRRDLAERVVAHQAFLDVYPREAVPAHGEAGGLTLAQVVVQRNALEAAVRAHELRQLVELARLDELERGELREHGVEALDLLGDGDELPGRQILRDDQPVAVVNQPARRRERLDAAAVTLRQLAEALGLEHLELHEAPDEHARQQQDDDRGRDDARQKQPLLLPVILERNVRPGHRGLLDPGLHALAPALDAPDDDEPQQRARHDRAPALDQRHRASGHAVDPEQDELVQKQQSRDGDRQLRDRKHSQPQVEAPAQVDDHEQRERVLAEQRAVQRVEREPRPERAQQPESPRRDERPVQQHQRDPVRTKRRDRGRQRQHGQRERGDDADEGNEPVVLARLHQRASARLPACAAGPPLSSVVQTSSTSLSRSSCDSGSAITSANAWPGRMRTSVTRPTG